MNDNEIFYDQIEAFLAGRLAPDQREAMEKAMLENPDLARELALRRLEFDVSEALIAQNIRGQLARLRMPPSPEPPPDPPAYKYKFRPLFWMIALMLTVAAIGGYWWSRQPTRMIPNQEQAPSLVPELTPPVLKDVPPTRANQDTTPPDRKVTPGSPENKPVRPLLAMATELYQRPDMQTLRGTAPVAGDAYELALSAWEKQDYTAVVTALQNISSDDPKWMRALTLRAHAQFNLKRFAQACESFATIADSKIMPWSEEAEWYVLLASLAEGKAETANFRARLEKLLSDQGHPYVEQAKDLKGRLSF